MHEKSQYAHNSERGDELSQPNEVEERPRIRRRISRYLHVVKHLDG